MYVCMYVYDVVVVFFVQSWFTHLPPVMILELSRFEYSTDSKQVLKINDSLDFEKVLYMDRFLLENRDATLASYDKEVSIKSQLQGDRDNYHRYSACECTYILAYDNM